MAPARFTSSVPTRIPDRRITLFCSPKALQVHLLEINVETTKLSKEWKVFQCIKGGEFVVAEIAAQKGWCRIHKRCLRLFGMPLPFSLSS
jgi:hypothetical protein